MPKGKNLMSYWKYLGQTFSSILSHRLVMKTELSNKMNRNTSINK